MPAGEVVLEDSDEAFLWVVEALGAGCGTMRSRRMDWKKMRFDALAHPKMRSGCDMKSVMRSSMLLGSRTKVGKVTLERSIPTLHIIEIGCSETGGFEIEGGDEQKKETIRRSDERLERV